jgi:hypothetical protein
MPMPGVRELHTMWRTPYKATDIPVISIVAVAGKIGRIHEPYIGSGPREGNLNNFTCGLVSQIIVGKNS